MQLIAGRTAWEYNFRKKRKGAYWEDRYHATAVDTGEHLFACMVYIDLNMIRAGVVTHPLEWLHGGYREIQFPPRRYRIIDFPALMNLCGVENLQELQLQRRLWLDHELQRCDLKRDEAWSQHIAVGSKAFVEGIKHNFSVLSRTGKIIGHGGKYVLKDRSEGYNAVFRGKMGGLSLKNTLKLDVY